MKKTIMFLALATSLVVGSPVPKSIDRRMLRLAEGIKDNATKMENIATEMKNVATEVKVARRIEDKIRKIKRLAEVIEGDIARTKKIKNDVTTTEEMKEIETDLADIKEKATEITTRETAKTIANLAEAAYAETAENADYAKAAKIVADYAEEVEKAAKSVKAYAEAAEKTTEKTTEKTEAEMEKCTEYPLPGTTVKMSKEKYIDTLRRWIKNKGLEFAINKILLDWCIVKCESSKKKGDCRANCKKCFLTPEQLWNDWDEKIKTKYPNRLTTCTKHELPGTNFKISQEKYESDTSANKEPLLNWCKGKCKSNKKKYACEDRCEKCFDI